MFSRNLDLFFVDVLALAAALFVWLSAPANPLLSLAGLLLVLVLPGYALASAV